MGEAAHGPTLEPAPRVDGSAGRPAVREHIRRGQPVIFENLIDRWPAVGKWSPSYLAETCGDTEVGLFDFTSCYSIPATVSQFAGWLAGERTGALAGHEDLYLSWDFKVLRGKPALRDDFDFASLFGPGVRVIHQAFWMGGDGSHTPVHYDLDAPNLHACVYGTKRFVLFGPDQTPHLYRSDVYEWTTEFSEVDFRAPDLDRHPAVQNARGIEAVLGPGDVLFLPGLWWHGAWCRGPCISLNGWWYGPSVLVAPRVLREVGRAALHKLGLYARGRCTCCGHGDLRRHHDWPERVPA